MVQNILALTIVLLAAIISVISVIKSITSKKASGCDGCSTCEVKDIPTIKGNNLLTKTDFKKITIFPDKLNNDYRSTNINRKNSYLIHKMH